MKIFNKLENGTVIGNKYTIRGIVGHGKSSTVYKASTHDSQSHVALKILDPYLAQDPVHLERFTREIEIIGKIQNPNIINIYDFIEDEDFKIIVMEYVPNGDLKHHISKNGPLTVKNFLSISKKLIKSIQSCHHNNIVHRDIKPHNILMIDDLTIKLVDFGISRINTMSDLTKTGTIIGTPEYMAPESFLTSQTDLRQDIYSLGVVLYEMLVGHPPFQGSSLSQIMTKQISNDYILIRDYREDIPDWIERIIKKCLSIDPNNRYQNCTDLERDFNSEDNATIVSKNELVVKQCTKCQTELLNGLPFCHNCGRYLPNIYERGKYSIIISKCENQTLLAESLINLFPQLSMNNVLKKIKVLPCLLFSKISEETAETLANEFDGLPAEIKVVSKLSVQLDLPVFTTFSFLSVTIAANYFIYQNLKGYLSISVCLTTFLLISTLLFFYKKQIQPVINLNSFVNLKKTYTDNFFKKMASFLPKLCDIKIQTMLGRICASRQMLKKFKGDLDKEQWTQIDKGIKSCLNKSKEIIQWNEYLQSTSINDIKRKIDIISVKIKSSTNIEETELLINQKNELQNEFKYFRNLQETYSNYITNLINFEEVLNSLYLDDLNWKITKEKFDRISEIQSQEEDIKKLAG